VEKAILKIRAGVLKATWGIHVKHLPELGSRPSAVVYNPVTEPLKYIRPDSGESYGNYLLYASGPNPLEVLIYS